MEEKFLEVASRRWVEVPPVESSHAGKQNCVRDKGNSLLTPGLNNDVFIDTLSQFCANRVGH